MTPSNSSRRPFERNLKSFVINVKMLVSKELQYLRNMAISINYSITFSISNALKTLGRKRAKRLRPMLPVLPLWHTRTPMFGGRFVDHANDADVLFVVCGRNRCVSVDFALR
jgi:hypothetical protein